MKANNEKPVVFWLIFLSLLTIAFMFQSAVFLGKYNGWPYLVWPPVLYFFLHYKGLSSLFFLLFVSLLSSLFLSLSLIKIFCLYLFCLWMISFVKILFFSKSSALFFVFVFAFSFCFPFLTALAYDFSMDSFFLNSVPFYFLKAFSTLILAFLMFPFLKKWLSPPASF